MKKLSLKLMTALMVLCFAVAISGCDQNTCGMSDKGCTAASCKCGKMPGQVRAGLQVQDDEGEGVRSGLSEGLL